MCMRRKECAWGVEGHVWVRECELGQMGIEALEFNGDWMRVGRRIFLVGEE